MEKSAYFRREGADVHTDAEISLSQAVLGGTIRAQGVYEDQVIQVCTIAHHPIEELAIVSKLNEFAFIQIMPGTASHTKICLNNKGMKRVNSYGNGDHYVHIKIAVPKKLTREQKALMQVSFQCPLLTAYMLPQL